MTLDNIALHPKQHLTHPKYRADIDGLRALAVLSVVGFHAFPDWIFGGFIGVDIFFVISGFLISGIIFGNLENNSFSYIEFYARRIKRIFPALILVLVLSFAFGWYVLLPDEFQQLVKHVAAGSGFVSNFTLWDESGYFDNSADTKPLLHLWSLAIEEQFYILWPLLLGLVWKHKWNFLTLTVSIAIVSFILNIYTVNNNPIAAFYSPLSRFWELMIGGILAYLTLHKPQHLPHRPNWQSAIGLMLIACGLLLINKERAFPGYWALIPDIGAFLIISAGSGAWLNRNFLGNRLMVGIGLISYPLYLWHWPLLIFSKIVVGRNLHMLERAAIILVSIGLAYLTYLLVENPIRKKTASSKPAAALLIAVVCILAVSLYSFVKNVKPRHKNAEITKLLVAAYDWSYPDGLKGKILAGHLRRAYELKSGLSQKTLFFGDSNMEQYYPRVEKLLSENPGKYNSAIFVGNQKLRCYPMFTMFIKASEQCDSVMKDITDIANDKDVISVVLIFSAYAYDHLIEEKIGSERLAQFINTISKSKRVYLILNMPDGEELNPKNMFTGSRLRTLDTKNAEKVVFDYQGFLDRHKNIRTEVTNLAIKNGAIVIDPIKYLCPDNKCPVFDSEGNPLYRDEMHMRASYVRSSAAFIDITVKPNSLANAPVNH
jgi:peptidoglycan/LPS O-acetylase OafA/YrhL